jgi:hypothetical protein
LVHVERQASRTPSSTGRRYVVVGLTIACDDALTASFAEEQATRRRATTAGGTMWESELICGSL